MSDNNKKKDNPASWLPVPSKKDTLDLSKFKDQPKYVQVFAIQTVICQNCTAVIAPQNPLTTFTVTEALLQDAAEKMHTDAIRAKALLCANPQLVILYGLGFMHNSLVK